MPTLTPGSYLIRSVSTQKLMIRIGTGEPCVYGNSAWEDQVVGTLNHQAEWIVNRRRNDYGLRNAESGQSLIVGGNAALNQPAILIGDASGSWGSGTLEGAQAGWRIELYTGPRPDYGPLLGDERPWYTIRHANGQSLISAQASSGAGEQQITVIGDPNTGDWGSGTENSPQRMWVVTQFGKCIGVTFDRMENKKTTRDPIAYEWPCDNTMFSEPVTVEPTLKYMTTQSISCNYQRAETKAWSLSVEIGSNAPPITGGISAKVTGGVSGNVTTTMGDTNESRTETELAAQYKFTVPAGKSAKLTLFTSTVIGDAFFIFRNQAPDGSKWSEVGSGSCSYTSKTINATVTSDTGQALPVTLVSQPVAKA